MSAGTRPPAAMGATGRRPETRILLTILPLVALMLGLMGWWSHRTVRREAELQERAGIERALGEAQRRIDGLLARSASDLKALSHSALIQRYHFDVVFGFNDAVEQDAAALEDSLRQLLEASPAYVMIAYRDEGGGVVARTRRDAMRAAGDDLEAAFAAIRDAASDELEPPVERLVPGGASQLRFGTVVRDDDRRPVGKLVLDLDLRVVREALDGLRRGPRSVAVILEDGRALLEAPAEIPAAWTPARLRESSVGALAQAVRSADPLVVHTSDALLGGIGVGLGPSSLVSGWAVLLAVPLQEFFGRIASVGRDTFVVTLAAVVLVSLVSSMVVLRISRELRIATTTLEGRMEDLARAKGELETTQAQLVQSAKLAALGELVAGVAHEMNNPLGFLYANVRVLARYVREIEEIARRGAGASGGASDGATGAAGEASSQDRARLDDLSAKVGKLIDGCQVGAERTKTIVEKLRTFARAGEGEIQSIDLNESLDTALMLLNHRVDGTNVEVHRDYGRLPRYACRAGSLNQVFVNLLANALDAIDGRGDVWIASCVRPATGEAPQQIEIRVRDSGPGLAPGVASRLFEPFFTTKGPTRGTGLGLSVSYGIVRDHGGTIEASNHPAGGAEFLVRLPVRGKTNDEVRA
ncbi:MAG: ATP-binding protein [bacterium]